MKKTIFAIVSIVLLVCLFQTIYRDDNSVQLLSKHFSKLTTISSAVSVDYDTIRKTITPQTDDDEEYYSENYESECSSDCSESDEDYSEGDDTESEYYTEDERDVEDEDDRGEDGEDRADGYDPDADGDQGGSDGGDDYIMKKTFDKLDNYDPGDKEFEVEDGECETKWDRWLCLQNFVTCIWEEGECIVANPGDESHVYGTQDGIFTTPTDDNLPYYRTETDEDASTVETHDESYGECASKPDRAQCVAVEKCIWEYDICLDPEDANPENRQDYLSEYYAELDPRYGESSSSSESSDSSSDSSSETESDDQFEEIVLEQTVLLVQGLTATDFPQKLIRATDFCNRQYVQCNDHAYCVKVYRQFVESCDTVAKQNFGFDDFYGIVTTCIDNAEEEFELVNSDAVSLFECIYQI